MLTLEQIKEAIGDGGYVAIMASGGVAIMKGKPDVSLICEVIDCDTLDSVTLSHKPDGVPELVMMVDDEGLLNNSPPNLEASKLAWKALGPGFVHQIHGNVVIVNDDHFGPDDSMTDEEKSEQYFMSQGIFPHPSSR